LHAAKNAYACINLEEAENPSMSSSHNTLYSSSLVKYTIYTGTDLRGVPRGIIYTYPTYALAGYRYQVNF
jgi:hypothetical protein